MFNMKKGHRPPPAFNTPDGKEPNVEGWDEAAFHASESWRSAEENNAPLRLYQSEDDPALLAYWAGLGVKKELFDTERGGGAFRYAVHTPLDLKPGEKLPLLYYSHGGMASPREAECYGFSKLIARERFLAVYPMNGGWSNEDVVTEFPRILDALREKGYPIDWERVYASGFSSGSDATESAATNWPERIAACAPCPGSNAMYNSLCRHSEEAYEKCLPLQMPMLFVCGTADFGDRYPFPDEECFENFNIWMERICKVDGYRPMHLADSQRLVAETADPTCRATGLAPQRTWTEHFEGRDWYFGESYNAAGEPVFRIVCGQDVPHITTGCHAALVWDYLKHWRRTADGASVYTP